MPPEECFLNIDLAKVDLAEEAPAILAVLNGSDPRLARGVAGVVPAVLMFRRDAKTKSDARALGPALIAHYDDPDPDQSPFVQAPTDSWKQLIMGFLFASDAVPPPALIDKMLVDLNRTGDAYGATAGSAALALAHLRPLPRTVLDALLARMEQSWRAKVQVIEAFGASRVSDPQVIQRISVALEAQVESDIPFDEASVHRINNEVRREAATALGKIGPAAKDALPALRRLAVSSDPIVGEDPREVARQAIRLIGEPQ